jgi:hypothetical protein
LNRIFLLLASVLISSSVFAEPTPKEQLEARFASADINHDGKLTKAEAEAGMPNVAKHFDQIDTAHAGFVTLPQIAAFIAQHRG